MSMSPYPQVNKLVPAMTGMRSSMKGAAFHLPLRPTFVYDLLTQYDTFTATHPDAHASMVAWELFDPSVVVASPDAGSFANRGWHLNSLVMPMWTKEENDGACRQWAREMSGRFKIELEEVHGAVTGEGPNVRGHKGAVLLYGNYDASLPFLLLLLLLLLHVFVGWYSLHLPLLFISSSAHFHA